MTVITRIMPLGDSITAAPDCWRGPLHRSLHVAGHPVELVGTVADESGNYRGRHEGHSGALATEIAEQRSLDGWLAEATPDVVLMHLGTNDLWHGLSGGDVLTAFAELVTQMRIHRADLTVFVAQIVPMAPKDNPEATERVRELNAAVPGWAESMRTRQSPVIVVDHWSGFDVVANTYDGVHPNASGDHRIAQRWFTALDAALDDLTALR